MFCEKRSQLIDAIEKIKDDWISKTFFQMKYFPLSSLRDRVEFNLVIALFR